MTEEAKELAAAKDELFALSTGRSSACSGPSTTTPRRSTLTGRVEAGRKEITELRARAAVQAASIEEIAGRLADIDAAADTSERDYEEQARAQEERRAALADARRRWKRRWRSLGGAGQHRATGGRAGGRRSARGTTSRRASRASADEDAAAGERLDARR